jgi:hypothetical protein
MAAMDIEMRGITDTTGSPPTSNDPISLLVC